MSNGAPRDTLGSYEQPDDEMVAIKRPVAFHPDKADSIAAGRFLAAR